VVKYIINAAVIMILYIPNIPIILHQLKMGGIEEWLAKPHNDFIINYISYIFQYSFVSLFVVAGLMIFGFIKREKMNYKWLIVSILWFFLPILIGFLYSKYINAVIQYSMLIFSFSFLFFILFGHIKKQKPVINLIMVVIILTVNTFLLVNERKHYTLFYNSPYIKILEDHETAHKKYENVASLIHSYSKVNQYYWDKIPVRSPFFEIDSISEKELVTLVKEQAEKADYLYLGVVSSNSPTTVPIIQEYFPNIKWQNNYQAATTYLFSKEERNCADTIYFSEITPLFIDSLTEYCSSFSKPLFEITSNQYNLIDVSVKFLVPESYEDIILVTSLENEKGSIYWDGMSFDKYVTDEDIGQWITIHHSLKLSDIYLKYNNIEFKAYIWNNGKQNFTIKDFTILLREGNPVMYGLMFKIR
jgi:cell division protein ZapA (FtsZ GTPase activity inhibitor)